MEDIINLISTVPAHQASGLSSSDLKQRIEERAHILGLSLEDYKLLLQSSPQEVSELYFKREAPQHHAGLIDSVSQNINEGIFRSELSQGLVYVNQAFTEMFGYPSREELLTGDPMGFYANPEDRQFLQDLLMKDGKYSKREIEFRRKDGGRFWGMISSICTKGENGQTFFDGVITDISEKKEAEQALTRLNQELVERNKVLAEHQKALSESNVQLKQQQQDLETALAKLSDRNFELDQLVYKVSHDLRAPISSVMGILNLLKIEEAESARNQYIGLAEMRLAKLDGFIRSMLAYSKANRSALTEEPISFDELIQEALQDLEYLPQFHKMKVQANVNMKGLAFYGDRMRLQIVLSNVISNAFKYMNESLPESFLKIDIYSRKGFIYLLFEDNGLGIEEQYLSRVFEMFFRATNNSEGSGLGLYLVKQTIELLNGTINLWSKPNKGTIMCIKLPIKKEPKP